MRKLEKRAIMCLMLAAILFLGIVVFTWRFVAHGAEWATFYGNTQVYTNGRINRGTIYDRNGVMLLDCTQDGFIYPDDYALRRSTVHVIGDPDGNIPDGVLNRFTGDLIGYDLLNGTYDTSPDGKSITLTIDSLANETAYYYLSNYDAGAMGIYNYKTGEILCMVSTPTIDPAWEEEVDPESSVYFNNFLQGAMTPGSTFKLVTAAAAIEELDTDDFAFVCDGINEYQGESFRCVSTHGRVDFTEAMADSCNGAFGRLARETGAEKLADMVDQVGLTRSVNVDGIETAKGSFYFPDNDDILLSWSGIGQGEDLVNPCAMMVYVGAIANDGEGVSPTLLHKSNFLGSLSGSRKTRRYLKSETAEKLRFMMKNNVVSSYGEYNYPDLDIYAKSGTAEVGDGEYSWFVGFIDDEEHPYAFVCWVDGGNGGAATAGPIVRETLYALIANN